MNASDSDQRLAKGTIVGPYEIIRLLGKGGMGEVYEAYEAKLFRKVALKIISEEVMHNSIALEHFISEGRTLAQLNHPNVVTIFQLGEDKGIQFIAMEFVEGEALDSLIERKLPSVAEAVFIFYKILLGVQALHKKGIIHRDLKPKNIMVPNPKNIKIVDFGIAEFITNYDGGKEKNNIPKGSVYYLSPEILEGNPATVQSDIWSLGVIFYNLLTGEKPFSGKDRNEIIQSIRVGKITLPLVFKATIPSHIIRIIYKMWALDLKQRYQNVDEIINDLKSKIADDAKKTKDLKNITFGLIGVTIFIALIYWFNANKFPQKTILPDTKVIALEKEFSTLTTKAQTVPELDQNKSSLNADVEKKAITTEGKDIVTEELPLQVEESKTANKENIDISKKVLDAPIVVEKKEEPLPIKKQVESRLKPPLLLKAKVVWQLDSKIIKDQRGIASYQFQTNNKYKLEWKKQADVTKYILQIAYDMNFNEKILQEEVQKNYFILNKPKLGEFFWRVKGVGKNKKTSDFSPIGTLITNVPAPQFLNKINKIRIDTKTTKKEFSLQWLPSDLVSAYSVRLIPEKGNLEKTEFVTKDTVVKIPIKSSVKFKAQIFALNEKRKPASSPSEFAQVEVVLGPPIQTPKLIYPLNKTVVPSQTAMITPVVCKWNNVQTADKYIFQISEDKQAKKIINERTLSETQIVLTMPFSRGEYFWRVKSLNQDGEESSWSSMYSFFID